MSADSETETIRWPTNLDRRAIEERLKHVAARAVEMQLPELTERFANVGEMPAAKIAANVVSSLTWILGQPQLERAKYAEITRDLEMVALNLKNLK